MAERGYQTHWRRVVYLIAGFAGLGELLHAISGAVEIVTPMVTYVGTAILAVCFLALRFLLPRLKPSWVVSEGRSAQVTRLGIQPVWFMVGAVVLLWIPRIADQFGKPKEPDRLEYDELASQWEDFASAPIEGITVTVTFPQASARAKDFEALLAGLSLNFEGHGSEIDKIPATLEFRSDPNITDPQKFLSLVILDHAGRAVPAARTTTQLWRQFEGADSWLCWWSSRFVWKNNNDFACSANVSAEFPLAGQMSLKDLFSFSEITMRAPYGLQLIYRGPESMPDPTIEVTFNTRRRAVRLPMEEFKASTEINDNTGSKSIVESLPGHELRRLMRDQFFKSGGLRTANEERPGGEFHTVTGTVDYISGFFPRSPTPAEWDKMRHLHPDLVPKNLGKAQADPTRPSPTQTH